MGKVTGVMTGWKGKVGNIVFAMWKGVQVVKTRVIPENPQSPDQTTNRDLFTALVLMFKGIITSLIRTSWDPFVEPGKSGWANLIGINQLEQAGTAIDYEKCILSQGSLGGESIVAATYDAASGDSVVTWIDSGAVDTDPTDVGIVFIFDSVAIKWWIKTATRGDETATQAISLGLIPAEVYCYLLFCKPLFTPDEIEIISDSDAKVTVAPGP